MKAIIEGKRYDTKTADQISERSGGGYCNDFHHYEEVLCRTQKGAWFLHGEGGALSMYGGPGPGQNERHGGQRIVPMTADEARVWLENNGDTSALEEHFGEEIEDA